MVSEYMVTCDLPDVFSEELMSIIPNQRRVVNKLFQTGVFTGYTLSLDHSKIWITLLSNDEENVLNILEKMPVMPYIKVEIYPLAFHNAARVVLPALSLN
jgi:hypothetical protein